MTAKREAELETENRMLREQVASLEKIIEGLAIPVRMTTTPGCVPYPWGGAWWYGAQVTCGKGNPDGNYSVASGCITLN